MDSETQLHQWDFVNVVPYLPLPVLANPYAHFAEAHKVLDRKTFEDEVQSQDSTDTTHSELIPFSESQSARVSLAISSKPQSRRDTMMSFGTASNPPSGRKSLPASDLISFIGNSEDQRESIESISVEEEVYPNDSPVPTPSDPIPPFHESPKSPLNCPQSPNSSSPTPIPATVSRVSFFSSANLDLQSESPIQSPTSLASPQPIPSSRAKPTLRVDTKPVENRQPWTKISKPPIEPSTGKKRRKGNTDGIVSLFDDDVDVYKVAHFIPRCSFTPAHFVDATITQHIVLNLPNLKIVVIKLVPGQRLTDFVNRDGDTTGHILRSQKSKLKVKIAGNEHNFSQGDYFYVPRGNPLTLQNQSERIAAIMQIVVTKACD